MANLLVILKNFKVPVEEETYEFLLTFEKVYLNFDKEKSI